MTTEGGAGRGAKSEERPARSSPSPAGPTPTRRDDGPLRILFVTPYYKPYLGGIERAIEQLGASLLADGHAVGVLTTHYAFPRQHMPGLPARETIDGGVRLYRLPSWPRRAAPFFSVPLVWFPPRAIAAALADFRPDAIHWVGDGWFWAHYWCWRYGRRRAGLVFTPSFHALRPAYRWLQPLNVFLARAADAVTVLSAIERRAVRRTYGARRARLWEIGWGVAAPAPRETPAPPRGWAPGRLTVLCVGRLGEHKGQGWLLDRLLRVRDCAPRPVRLVLAGRDEGGEAALRERVRREGLDDLVLLTGEVDDDELHRWYAHADLFALFSRYEAFGLVYLEAMAHGLPVLTHAVGAATEIARRGAIVVPAFDAPAAEAALAALLADDERRAALGREAAAYAAGHSWPAVAARFTAVYRASLQGKMPWPGWSKVEGRRSKVRDGDEARRP